MVRLDDKLARIRGGAYRRSDFIIADAKDPDMGPGLHAVGPAPAATERAAIPDSRGVPRFDRGDRQAGRRRHHADLGLESRASSSSATSSPGTGVKPVIRANDTTDVWRHRGATVHHRAVAPVPHRLAQACEAADRSRALFDHLHQRHRRRLCLARGVQGLSRRRRSQRLLLFSRSVQSECRARRLHGGDDASVRQRLDHPQPRRPHRGGAAAIPQDRLQRAESPGRAGVLRSGSGGRRAGRRRGHRRATVSSSFIRRKNMARVSRCSAARSISPNRRSTSCVSCARSPTATCLRSRRSRTIMRRS